LWREVVVFSQSVSSASWFQILFIYSGINVPGNRATSEFSSSLHHGFNIGSAVLCRCCQAMTGAAHKDCPPFSGLICGLLSS
jgi:hypothetical protein